MTIMVHIAMLGFIPLVLGLFLTIPPRRAIIAGYLIGWLFLPVYGYHLPGIPDYSKTSAVEYALLLCIVLFDFGRLMRFRPRWFDVPVIVMVVGAFLTSVVNGLGAYDGMSQALNTATMWGMPYLVGRLYFSDMDGARELAIGIVIGAVIYVPLCLWEIRMSPQLHAWVYGFSPQNALEWARYGGYRPLVFMGSSLMTAMWITTAMLVAFWLWTTRSVRSIMGWPILWLLGALTLTSLLTHAAGAMLLSIFGGGALYFGRMLRTPLLLIALMAAPPIYMTARLAGWSGEDLIDVASATLGPARAESLGYRMKNENLLSAHALDQPVLGWGGWGRNRVYDETGKDISVTDGLWIIELGEFGIVGLVSVYLMILLPPALVLWRFRGRLWTAAAAPVMVLATLLILHGMDDVLNAMVNPIFILAMGGLIALRPGAGPTPAPRRTRRLPRARPIRRPAPAPRLG